MFIDLGACRIVDDAAQLVAAVDHLLANPDEAAKQGGNGRSIVQRNRGALARLLTLLEPLIGEEKDAPV